MKKGKRGGFRPGAGRHPVEKKQETVSFRWPEELRDAVIESAKAHGIKKTTWIKQACYFYLEETKKRTDTPR